MVMDLHRQKKHCATNTLLSIIREKFWIVKARKLVDHVVYSPQHGCIECRRYRLKPYSYPQAPDLPEERVKSMRPFGNCGVDYFGPLKVKTPNGSEKVWVALYTCLTIRAIHLELADSYSAESFLRTFRRFVARRGVPDIMMSDHGTNFELGSKLILDKWKDIIQSEEVQTQTAQQGITWRFTTPRAPWTGGSWEVMVKITKNSLKRTVGRSLLSWDELSTLLTEIEAVVNSRPLTFMYEREPMRALKPVDFLIPYSRVQTNLPNEGVDDPDDPDFVPDAREAGYAQLQRAWRKALSKIDIFRRQWSQEYLPSLRERDRQKIEKGVVKESPKEGDIVLIEEEDNPRSRWSTGVIKKLRKGRDGIVRSADLMSNKRMIQRAINQLYPLEINPNPIPDQLSEEVVAGIANLTFEAMRPRDEPRRSHGLSSSSEDEMTDTEPDFQSREAAEITMESSLPLEKPTEVDLPMEADPPVEAESPADEELLEEAETPAGAEPVKKANLHGIPENWRIPKETAKSRERKQQKKLKLRREGVQKRQPKLAKRNPCLPDTLDNPLRQAKKKITDADKEAGLGDAAPRPSHLSKSAFNMLSHAMGGQRGIQDTYALVEVVGTKAREQDVRRLTVEYFNRDSTSDTTTSGPKPGSEEHQKQREEVEKERQRIRENKEKDRIRREQEFEAEERARKDEEERRRLEKKQSSSRGDESWGRRKWNQRPAPEKRARNELSPIRQRQRRSSSRSKSTSRSTTRPRRRSVSPDRRGLGSRSKNEIRETYLRWQKETVQYADLIQDKPLEEPRARPFLEPILPMGILPPRFAPEDLRGPRLEVVQISDASEDEREEIVQLSSDEDRDEVVQLTSDEEMEEEEPEISTGVECYGKATPFDGSRTTSKYNLFTECYQFEHAWCTKKCTINLLTKGQSNQPGYNHCRAYNMLQALVINWLARVNEELPTGRVQQLLEVACGFVQPMSPMTMILTVWNEELHKRGVKAFANKVLQTTVATWIENCHVLAMELAHKPFGPFKLADINVPSNSDLSDGFQEFLKQTTKDVNRIITQQRYKKLHPSRPVLSNATVLIGDQTVEQLVKSFENAKALTDEAEERIDATFCPSADVRRIVFAYHAISGEKLGLRLEPNIRDLQELGLEVNVVLIKSQAVEWPLTKQSCLEMMSRRNCGFFISDGKPASSQNLAKIIEGKEEPVMVQQEEERNRPALESRLERLLPMSSWKRSKTTAAAMGIISNLPGTSASDTTKLMVRNSNASIGITILIFLAMAALMAFLLRKFRTHPPPLDQEEWITDDEVREEDREWMTEESDTANEQEETGRMNRTTQTVRRVRFAKIGRKGKNSKPGLKSILRNRNEHSPVRTSEHAQPRKIRRTKKTKLSTQLTLVLITLTLMGIMAPNTVLSETGTNERVNANSTHVSKYSSNLFGLFGSRWVHEFKEPMKSSNETKTEIRQKRPGTTKKYFVTRRSTPIIPTTTPTSPTSTSSTTIAPRNQWKTKTSPWTTTSIPTTSQPPRGHEQTYKAVTRKPVTRPILPMTTRLLKTTTSVRTQPSTTPMPRTTAISTKPTKPSTTKKTSTQSTITTTRIPSTTPKTTMQTTMMITPKTTTQTTMMTTPKTTTQTTMMTRSIEIISTTSASSPVEQSTKPSSLVDPRIMVGMNESPFIGERGRREKPALMETAKPVYWCAYRGSTIWKIMGADSSPFCQNPPAYHAKWQSLTIHLYSKIQRPKPIEEAYHCSIKRVSDELYTNLLGDSFHDPKRELLLVNRQTCRDMLERQICPHSDAKMMLQKDGSWSTNNILEETYPGRWSSLIHGSTPTNAVNCFLQKATLYYHPHNLELLSPVHHLDKDCKFSHGFCSLSDNSSLIWPMQCVKGHCRTCDYDFVEEVEGEFAPSTELSPATWISHNREIALTFVTNATAALACDGWILSATEQGFYIRKKEYLAIMATKRSQRDVGEQQLAAQLTASQLATGRAIHQLFQKECRRSIRGTNPTIQARQLLNQSNIVAKWIGEHALEVYQCATIQMQHINFRPINETCYRFIPVEVRVENETLQAFLDPELRVLSTTSEFADCGLYRFHHFQLNDKIWWRIDTKSGQTHEVEASKIHEIYESISGRTSNDMLLQPLIFKQWHLGNDSELIPFPHLEELGRWNEWKERQAERRSSNAFQFGKIPLDLPQLASEWLASIWATFIDYWIKAACLYASFLAVRDLIIPLALAYLLNPILASFRAMMGLRGSEVAAVLNSPREEQEEEAIELRPRSHSSLRRASRNRAPLSLLNRIRRQSVQFETATEDNETPSHIVIDTAADRTSVSSGINASPFIRTRPTTLREEP